MKELHIITVLLFLMFQTTFSQTKEIKGDTVYWYKHYIELQKTLDLKNFEQSTDEFNFRFRNHGQVIEISKDSSRYSGNITNYIYHTKKANKNSEILSNKIVLSSQQSEAIYNIIEKSKIIDLPTDNEIENWKKGFDGIEYIIEHSDKKTYWFKNYWTPTSQDSIPEAIIVLELVKNLSEALELQQIYTSFQDTLPKKGCYNWGGIGNMCYISNSFELGYSGATKLPWGFYSSYSITYLGNAKINSSVVLQYNYDNVGFHHLNVQYAKWNLFYTSNSISDFVAYNYQNRLLNFDNTKNKFENHQINYGLNLKNYFGLRMGFDFMSQKTKKIGGHLSVSKWFSKTNVDTMVSTSIFDNRINYKAELFKSFNFNWKLPVHRISLGLAYEDFMKYKDLYFSIRMLL